MNALSQFLQQYAQSGTSRLHMPGHKGNCSFLEPLGSKWDVTEIQGADSLYQSSGAIAELERQLSALYHAQTMISAGGSTLCIQAMVKLCARRRFVAMRGSHAAFFHACALLGVDPQWLPFEADASTGLARVPSAEEIDRMLSDDSRPAAVYLTSPDYYGRRVDVAAVSEVCRRHRALLVVDNAHGAHLGCLQENLHPMALGADICCDSLHKTLPALTGAALLHLRPGLQDRREAKAAMAMFGSSSPSYLIMHSIGLCADWMQTEAASAFAEMEDKRRKLLKLFRGRALPSDCSKVSVDAYSLGRRGSDLAGHFRALGIEPEYADERYVVLLLSCFLSETDWEKLAFAFLRIPVGAALDFEAVRLSVPERVSSMRGAMLAPSERVSIERAGGRVCAETLFVCPPGVPLAAPGERIDENMVRELKKSGILSVGVVK